MKVRLTAARCLVAAAALTVLLVTQLAEARRSLEGSTTLALPSFLIAPHWRLQRAQASVNYDKCSQPQAPRMQDNNLAGWGLTTG